MKIMAQHFSKLTPYVYQKVVFHDTAANSYFLVGSTVKTDRTVEYEGKTYTSAFRVAQYTKPHYEIDVVLEKENLKTGEPIWGKIQFVFLTYY